MGNDFLLSCCKDYYWQNNEVIARADDLKKNDKIDLRFTDGVKKAIVE